MTHEQLQNRIKYYKAQKILKTLLQRGTITEEIYVKADRLCAERCP